MLLTPLSSTELDMLEDFLMSEATPDKCMDLEALDGFFTALICSPEAVMPGEYLPVVWGQEHEDDGPVFESHAQAQQILSLLMRHWHTIASTLEAGKSPTPLLYQEETEGAQTALGADWALGFMRGLFLRKEAWQPYIDDEEYAGPLVLIIALAEALTPEQRAKMLGALPACILLLYRYWWPHRQRDSLCEQHFC